MAFSIYFTILLRKPSAETYRGHHKSRENSYEQKALKADSLYHIDHLGFCICCPKGRHATMWTLHLQWSTFYPWKSSSLVPLLLQQKAVKNDPAERAEDKNISKKTISLVPSLQALFFLLPLPCSRVE